MNGSKKLIFLRWEKWRLGYNLILFVESLWLLRRYLLVALADWHFMVLFAIAANIFYCLGPLIEIGIWAFWGSPTDQTRYQLFLVRFPRCLFWVGLMLSMMLVYILVIHSWEYLEGVSDSPHPYF